MTRDTRELTLDLGRMRYTHSLEPGYTLHEREVRRVLDLIRAQVRDGADPRKLAKESDEVKLRQRHRHDAILVQGQRGAGKTTLLLTVHGALGGGACDATARGWFEDDAGWQRDVHALPPLDPTLVEGEEIFLGTIIANILRALRDKHQGQYFWDEHTELGEAFEMLGKGLQVLASDASQAALKRAATNPDLFAERLLSNAMSGLDLAARFHDFCIEACAALGVKLLVQPLDDADVSIRQGWDVLETVRRYLSNAQILPIMLGDLRLFRLVIEQHQRKQLGKLHAGRDVDRQLKELSEQYLLKLLRPDRRVSLPGAIARLESLLEDGGRVMVQFGRSPASSAVEPPPAEVPLTKLLSAVGERVFGIVGGRPDDLLGLFSENTRELRGVLMWLADVDQQATPLAPEAMEPYLEVFSNAPEQQRLPKDAIHALFEGRLDPWVRWLSRAEGENREPLWLLDLQPESRDAEPLAVRALKYTVGGALYLRWRQHPAEQLRYFGGVLSPMTQWPEPGAGYEAAAAAFRLRLRLGRGEPAWLTVARVTVSMIDPGALSSGSHTVFFGPACRLPPRTRYRKADTYGRVIVSMLSHRNAQKAKPRLGIVPWLDMLVGNEPAKHGAIEDLLIPVLERWRKSKFGDARLILGWFTVTARRGTRTYELIDPWKGIAAIGDLVRAWRRRERAGPAMADNKARREALESELRRILAQSELSIPVAAPTSDEPLDTIADLEEGESENERLEISTEILNQLLHWLAQTVDDQGALAPSSWAQLAQRFGENLNRIDEDLEPPEHSAGADLERWVLAFLHHLLIVEAEVRGKAPASQRGRLVVASNIRARERKGGIVRVPFSTNLGRVDPRELPVFAWLARCPILLAVLANDWRAHLAKALNPDAPDERPGGTKGELAGVEVDIHTALCALVPRFTVPERLEGEIPPTLDALRALVRELLGWQSDVPGAAADDAESDDDA